MFVFIKNGVMFLHNRINTPDACIVEMVQTPSPPHLLNNGDLIIPFTYQHDEYIKHIVDSSKMRGSVEEPHISIRLDSRSDNDEYLGICISDTNITVLRNKYNRGFRNPSRSTSYPIGGDVFQTNHLFAANGHEGLSEHISYGIYSDWEVNEFYDFFLSLPEVSYHDLLVIPIERAMVSVLESYKIRHINLTISEMRDIVSRVEDGIREDIDLVEKKDLVSRLRILETILGNTKSSRDNDLIVEY